MKHPSREKKRKVLLEFPKSIQQSKWRNRIRKTLESHKLNTWLSMFCYKVTILKH